LHDALDDFRRFLTEACATYERSAPTVAAYLDDLYVRLNEDPARVRLAELLGAARLREEGQWMKPNLAANSIYHLMHRLGLDTTGQAGF
jgi:hypothetical protein